MNREIDGTYDFLIVGSGAGGSAAAYALAMAGRRVLMLERGERLPDDGSTLDVDAVLAQGHFKSRETWADREGRPLVPEEFFNLGGKTRWYGAALLRFEPADFAAEPAAKLLGWPLATGELDTYYARAERLLGVNHFDAEPDLKRIARRLRAWGWTVSALPLGLSKQILDDPVAATRFDGFAIPGGLKADAQHRLLDAVADRANLTVATGAEVVRLLPASSGSLRIRGVQLADGRCFMANTVLLAGGALHSPRLLQRYLAQQGLEQALPSAANVGRNFKRHLLTAVLGFSLRPQHDHLRKTVLLTHPRFVHSSAQPLGGWIDREIVRLQFPRWLPRGIVEFFAQRVYGFFLQTEDGSDADNRVIDAAGRRPSLEYRSDGLPQQDEHRRFVRHFMRGLLRAGLLPFKRTIPLEGTAHACGTLVAGNDPRTSVVDADGRVHGFDNLYVVDGSVLPRSSRMNPALTIYAWSLRVADRLLGIGRAADRASKPAVATDGVMA